MTATAPRRPPSIATEVAAALLVPAGAFGFVRVFIDIGSILPILGASLMSTAIAVALRRLHVPLLLAAVVSITGLGLLIVNRYAPGTSSLGIIPTGESLDALDALLTDGLDQFRGLRAPVPDLPPFIAAAMVGAWIMAFLTDWGALRLRLAFEPVLPAGLLFIFSAVLGAGDRRVLSTLVFALIIVGWTVVHRTTGLIENSVWLSADRQRGPSGVARSAVVLSLVAVVIGAALGPRLPGADDEELYYWRNRSDPTRVVVSPFVEISSRLVEQSDVNLFTVKADRPAYWRLAGLDTYNEERASWTTTVRFEPTDGALPGEQFSSGPTLTQTITIENLNAIWLPAAFAPKRVIETTDGITWNSATASLAISDGEGDAAGRDSDGITYTIESALPVFTTAQLLAAPDTVPSEIADRYTLLPESLTPRLEREALEITAGAATHYEKALALQEHFRAFDYNVSLTARTGDPIEQFLDERVGFCQQFAGTFALMARKLGLPTRVAVGFTWGERVEGQPDTYQVTGRQTHAWPEVWFDGLGWVPFEPTPGRGAPNAEYTNTTPLQDALTEVTPADTTGTTLPGDGGPTTTFNPDIFEDSQLADVGGAGAAQSGGRSYGPTWLWVSIALVALYAVGMPLLDRLRRARRHRHGSTPTVEIESLWADAADDLLVHFGIERRPSETRLEFARRVRSDNRVPADALDNLAKAVTLARFGGDDASASVLPAAREASRSVHQAVTDRTTAWQRWKDRSHPRRIIRPTERPVRPDPAPAAVKELEPVTN